MMENIRPLPNPPKFYELSSPKVVQIFDNIIVDLENGEKYFEFCYFAREYPRYYRYYLSCAEFRLKEIYRKYQIDHAYFSDNIQKRDDDCFEMALTISPHTYAIYWDFEAFLSAINTSLDILARIVGTAYDEQMPPSFNKLCSKNLNGPANILKKAQKIWVSKMKDYRDCFVHYVPIDRFVSIKATRYSNGWEIRGKLPINPNIREPSKFKFSRRVELLKYSISVFKHMLALDNSVAIEIYKLYKINQFPKRIDNLVHLGERKKKPTKI